MENKYFTPEISDFYIGYEYETIYLKSVWTKETLNIMDAGWFFESYHNDAIPTEFRVPYLTKEQIEAEGWTSFITEYKGDIVPENMTYIFFREDRNYMLGWNFNTNKITLIIKDPSLVENYYNEPTFRGECKDINTFRKIIKLLGI